MIKQLSLGLLAVTANGGLFLVLAWANVATKTPPARDSYVLREVFHAAPPPRAEALPEEIPREIPEFTPPSGAASLTTDAPAPERFDLRGSLPGLDLSVGTLPVGPAIRTGAGGSPDGVAGGIPGGIPGGTGTAPVYSIAAVDRGPQRSVTPLPPYPQWARTQRLEAVVTLQIVVDATGAVRSVDLQGVEGDARFGDVARDAVQAWRYEPALLNGRPVPVTLIQRVRFQLVD